MDLGLEGGNINVIDTMDPYLEKEFSYIKELSKHLLGWVNTIKMPLEPAFKLIGEKKEDVYLTFNYTLVLEGLYLIEEDNILHIHVSKKDNENPLIIGHGNKELIKNAYKSAYEAWNLEYPDEMGEAAYNAIAKYYERTLKDVNSYISLNMKFFERLEKLKEIHIIGHSLGDVDIPYLKKIHQMSGADTKWVIYFYEISDEEKFKKKIVDIGILENLIIMKNVSEIEI
jgi:hypothetical protein